MVFDGFSIVFRLRQKSGFDLYRFGFYRIWIWLPSTTPSQISLNFSFNRLIYLFKVYLLVAFIIGVTTITKWIKYYYFIG